MALTLPGKQVPIVYFRYFEKFFLSLISDSIFVNAKKLFQILPLLGGRGSFA